MTKKLTLRRRAEKALKTDTLPAPETVSTEEARHLIHELQVHQIELNMQNEELRRTQEEIEISRARYFDLYDLSPAGYVTLSKTGLITEANLTVATLLGETRNMLIHQPITRFIHPEDQGDYYLLRKRVLETAELQTGDMRFLHADGSSFWARLQAVPRADAEFWITLTDVTEHKQTEKVRSFLARIGVPAKSLGFFKELTRYLGEQLSMDFVCINRLEGGGLNERTLEVWSDGKFENNAVYALKDTLFGALVEKSFCCFPADVLRLFPNDDVLRELKAESCIGVTIQNHTGQPNGLIVVIGRHPLSNPSRAEFLLKTVASRAGFELARLIIEEALLRANNELEERVLKRTEDLEDAMTTLKESQSRYRTLLENTDDLVWETDRNGVYTYVSPRSVDLLGYAPEQVIGSLPHDFTHPAKYEETVSRFKKILENGYRFRGMERICRHREGHSVIVESSGVPFFDSFGNIAGLRGIDRDITVRKNLEVQAMQTRHLAAIGELAAGVAHEINNPINGIINYAQILVDDAMASGEDPEIPRRIIKEGDRVADIVKNLLFFSRQTGGEKKPISVGLVLEDSLALFAPQFRKEGIHVGIDIPEDIPLITAHRQQIQQVFVNILANSRHALSQRTSGFNQTKRIEINARAVAVNGTTSVEMNFFDNGTGIAPEMLEWIFDPFFTTKAAGEGTGLGLSISYGIVQDHGGNMVVESEAGEYTLAKVSLPVNLASRAAEGSV